MAPPRASSSEVGIAAWGVYLPSTLAHKTLEPRDVAKTTAAWDEDSFTMAIEAGRDCLEMYEGQRTDARRGDVEAVFVVRSGELHDPGGWALLTALGLGATPRLLEFPAGPDGSADALDVALAEVESGRLRCVLVIASAISQADGAAAVVVGPAAVIEHAGRSFVNLPLFWPRGSGDVVPRRLEEETLREGLRAAVDGVLGDDGHITSEVDSWSLSSPAGCAPARQLGLDPSRLATDEVFSHAGCADFLIRVVAMCSAAEPGERLLILNVGARVSAYLWQAMPDLPTTAAVLPVQIKRTVDFARHGLELRKRELVAIKDVDPMDYAREVDVVLRLIGTKCEPCGRVTAKSRTTAGNGSGRRRCEACGGELEVVALASEGTVRSFTRSHAAEWERDEPTTYTVCDLDGGGRMVLELAGSEEAEVEIGARVSLVLRRVYRVHGHPLYLWKAVPTP